MGDIRQLEPNIHAGVKYVRFMLRPILREEPMDALNKGCSCLRVLQRRAGPHSAAAARAERAGLNPNVWFGNVERVASEQIGRETVTM